MRNISEGTYRDLLVLVPEIRLPYKILIKNRYESIAEGNFNQSHVDEKKITGVCEYA